jgi:hypothetical protein
MPTNSRSKVPVTERALMARINRKLSHDDEVLKKCRPDSQWYHDLGDYYGVDLRRNAVVYQHRGLEEFGRELGVLRDFEELAQ